ncbi:unnamed protein product [Heligmosomoides polygyrus]|uniref:Uncharacterized protein n=1 Tax=Heligmosomoides polygyrus TaxID=6339 RepID=A0A183F8Q7_HELPZ|nr:unnamed protein product [Heligmosomoides polygyrus]
MVTESATSIRPQPVSATSCHRPQHGDDDDDDDDAGNDVGALRRRRHTAPPRRHHSSIVGSQLCIGVHRSDD